MTVCFNTLSLIAPNTTTNRFLAKGFENCDLDDWGLSPQGFSFQPFIDAYHDDSDTEETRDTIWTNWIERQQADRTRENLKIEFESESEPPMHAINSLIKWLDGENLTYQLNITYRLENNRFEGQLNAQGPH